MGVGWRSRERVARALSHEAADRVPFDASGTRGVLHLLEGLELPDDVWAMYAEGDFETVRLEIARHEVGEWLAVEVRFGEDDGGPGTYALSLDGETVAEGLRFRTDGFVACNWVGFAGMGEEVGVFSVDEVRVE